MKRVAEEVTVKVNSLPARDSAEKIIKYEKIYPSEPFYFKTAPVPALNGFVLGKFVKGFSREFWLEVRALREFKLKY